MPESGVVKATSDSDIESWAESDEEVDPSAMEPSAAISLEERYSRTQLQIVRTSMDFTLHNLKQSLHDKTYINLAPSYQRRSRWDGKKRSQLIESFLMNIPVPSLFLFENSYNQYEVMDGRQRLETIGDFLDNKFPLSGLEFWLELNGKRFLELPVVLQRGLLRRTISATVLLAETRGTIDATVDVRMVLFKRLNTGGVRLNPQELRNALYPSPFNAMLERLAKLKQFTEAWGIPEHPADNDADPKPSLLKNALFRSMTDCELVLRFFAIKETVIGDKRGSLRVLLDKAMREHQTDGASEIEGHEKEFEKSLDVLWSTFGANPFVLPKTGKPSRPLYDALMVAASLLAHELSDGPNVTSRLASALANPPEYEVLVGRGNTVEAIKERVALAKTILMAD